MEMQVIEGLLEMLIQFSFIIIVSLTLHKPLQIHRW